MARTATLVTLTVTLALASCASPSPSRPPSASASISASPTHIASVVPGRPYDAAALLAAMRDSRRPGGVPDRLETDAVAQSLATQIWTWNGAPWTTISVGGACGPSSCTLEVAGSRDGTAGADLYSFEVATDEQLVLVTADLHAYDASLDEVLDRAARAGASAELAALAFVGAGWLPPPDAGVYLLAYRSGGEEGAPGLDLLLDLASGRIISRDPV